MEESSSGFSRRELKRQMRAANRAVIGRKGMISRVLWVVALIAIIGGAIAWFVWSVLQPLPGVKVPIQSREHIEPGTSHEAYSSNPPTSGPHYAKWSKCGIFEEPILIETLIHNMEHSAVVVLYKPDLAKEEVQKLKDFVTPLLDDGWILMAQNSDIPSNIALASWGRYQLFSIFDKEGMQAFYKANKTKGPERIPCEVE